jgi:glycine/D-amino acid oxidase-like deaminating enzyme
VLHGAIYHRIAERHGPAVARAYHHANRAGLDLLVRLHGELGVPSPLERRPALTFTAESADLPLLRRELDAARSAGVAATWVDDPATPFPALAAVEVADQWQFDPVPYLEALAAALTTHPGCHVFEETTVRGLPDPLGRHLRCDAGRVRAEHVVLATGIPLADRGLFFARQEARRSYALALRTPDPLPEGMYLGIDEPTRSVRTLPDPDDPGRRLLLVGGGGHVAGRDADPVAHQQDLLAWARRHVDVTEVTHRWSAQDYLPADGLPFVGPLLPVPGAPLVATGFAKWGMTNGSAAGLALAGRIAGDPPAWAATFDPARVGGARGVRELVRLNASVGAHLVGDHLAVLTGRTLRFGHPPRPEPEHRADGHDGDPDGRGGSPSVPPGRIRREGRHYVGTSAASAEADPCRVEAICPHLGGVLAWNDAEASWDCPLHGSRFDRCGRLLQGPATRDLNRLDGTGG